MTAEKARQMIPAWANEPETEKKEMIKFNLSVRAERFVRDHMITILLIAAMIVEGVIVGGTTAHNVRVETEERLAAEYAAQLEAYKAEQAYQQQAQSFLSGSDSLQVAINKEVDAVAPVIAKLSTDSQKATETCCMLARVMSPSYPNSFEEVAKQAQQWMFYDGTDNTYSERDRQIAESIIRPYMESGIIPKGLTSAMVYAEWTPNDYVLRDSWETTSRMRTWRWSA